MPCRQTKRDLHSSIQLKTGEVRHGGGGNDILFGGAGDNTIRGGTGFDIVVIAGTQGGAQVSNNGGGNFVIRAQDGSIA
ncbi:MAG: hypothetical protein ACE361_26555 [Aureliella sp.]